MKLKQIFQTSLVFGVTAVLITTLFQTPSVKSLFSQDGVGIVPTKKDDSQPLTRAWFINTIRPGESVTLSADVINSTAEDKVIEVKAKDSEQTGEGSFSYIPNEVENKLVGTWITLASSELTIPSQKQQSVEFTVKVPEGTAPGEYTGVISVQTAPKESDAAVKFVSRVGSRVYITVPGDLKTGTEVNNFGLMTSKNPKYGDFLQKTQRQPGEDMFITMDYNNSGNIYQKTKGAIKITQPNGEVVELGFDRDFAPREEAVNILLDTKAKWTVGNYKAEFTFENTPVIGFNKENVVESSSANTKTIEFTMTQEILDEMIADKAASRQVRDAKVRAAEEAGTSFSFDAIEVQAEAETKTEATDNTLIIVLGSVIGVLVLAIIGALVFFFIKKKKDDKKVEPKTAVDSHSDNIQ